MTISTVRLFVGNAIAGFGATAFLCTVWFFAVPPEASPHPDTVHGMLYACQWDDNPVSYYSAYAVIKSWDWEVCGGLFFLGSIIGYGSRDYPWEAGAAMITGAIFAIIFFALGCEKPLIEGLMSLGLRPPVLSCFPTFRDSA